MGGDIGVRNVTCITRHCGGQMASCGMDEMCRSNMQCAGSCDQTNTTCTFMCSESYQSPVIDSLMRCMFVDHKCLYLPDPDPINNATCRDPTDSVVSAINQDLMQGTWYVNYGFNPDYDCFECQELSFDFSGTDPSAPIHYEALYDLIAVNGTLIWNDVVMTGDEKAPGIINLVGQNNGFDNVQDWYVMVSDEDTLVAYYCGYLMTWHFEGVLVMSKTPEFNQAKMPLVEQAMASLDLTVDDLCKLNPVTGCPSADSSFLQ